MEIRWSASEFIIQISSRLLTSTRIFQVGPMTNLYQTECWAEHLTQFASGLSFLPEPIRWENVFRNTDFNRNRTIYLTVIIVFLLYIVLMIYSRYYDRKDLNKVIFNDREGVHPFLCRSSVRCGKWSIISVMIDISTKFWF